jgi:hypothetical protein
MIKKEITNLHEAYASIYAPVEEYQEPQELTEEVVLASQYFYEMGLNEVGVEILIEELGLDQFVDFVYDIAEEYYLTEARARGEKIEPKLSTGKPIIGKPKTASLKALRKKKAARQEAEAAASAAKPSGLKASLQRQSAIADASKRQPPRRGVLDTMAGAVLKGLDRHNAAMKKWAPVGKQLSRTGDILKKGLGTAAKAAFSEEVEEWVNALVEEGYDLSEYTWDDMTEMYEEILDEGRADKMAPPEHRAKLRNARAGFAILKGDSATKVRQKEHEERRGERGNIGGEGNSSYRYDDNADRDYPSFRVRGRGLR